MAIKNPITVSVVLQIKFPSGLWYSFLSEMPFEFGWTKLNDLRSCFVVEVIKSHGLALTHVQVESHVKIFSIWNKSFSLKYIQFEHCSHCTDSWFSRITTHTHTHTQSEIFLHFSSLPPHLFPLAEYTIPPWARCDFWQGFYWIQSFFPLSAFVCKESVLWQGLI